LQVPAAPKTKAQLKNEKRRENKKSPGDELGEAVAGMSLQEAPTETEKDAGTVGAASTLSEKDKKVRKLSKILREIESLQAKVDSGEVTPDDKQAAKLARRDGILDEIGILEQDLGPTSKLGS